MPGEPGSYARAGVSLRAQEEMNRAAIEASRWSLEALGVDAEGLGGYAAAIGHGGLKLSLHMDGVDTKTLVLAETGEWWVAGWDCVAMNTNDLAAAGYKPLAVADYVSMPRPLPDVFREIVWGAARAAAHLTGGGWAKLLRIIPPGAAAEVEPPPPPPVFNALVELGGLDEAEAYQVFNMGIGMVLAVPREKLPALAEILDRNGLRYQVVGRVVEAEPGTREARIRLPGGGTLRLQA
jgi:phosphoribosylaminoimidazole (AIR) synthetase